MTRPADTDRDNHSRFHGDDDAHEHDVFPLTIRRWGIELAIDAVVCPLVLKGLQNHLAEGCHKHVLSPRHQDRLIDHAHGIIAASRQMGKEKSFPIIVKDHHDRIVSTPQWLAPCAQARLRGRACTLSSAAGP
jgi:hypothetical protein